ncbi:MAG TPA: DNA-3-methyladenine glycosylase I [Gammaproteobacteria bacterium]|nr:DNA-3-methyladenine glycosylase I [Gammaproteobacteria bacterium]
MIPRRCDWCGTEPIYVEYHDSEWGVPNFDDASLFEFLLLEGAQAGLSWITVLKKREGYRQAFDGFDAEKIARYGQDDVNRLLQNSGIIRNRLKVESAVTNACAFLDIKERYSSFSDYVWQFVGGLPRQNRFRSLKQVPAMTSVSDAMSKQLKKDGFRFVGSIICYAFMQATGMVNDHLVDCHRHEACAELSG